MPMLPQSEHARPADLKKYGAIPSWAQTRLDQAGPEQLETWADAILESETLEALLSEAPRH
ncbi:hypothetical protein [Ectothiorhodospira sp. PHS-1]|uniref:hypothetical protein n=1 Tax=Ectothiorhodospira sp. PHS-1 TaxID=519989 RepID=UPI00143B2774|nr:hypothetical protein [Ectothiorhodospira sp. PHS-1]